MEKIKKIEIDIELYQYISLHAKYIGEQTSTILRRMLHFYVIKKHNYNTEIQKKYSKKFNTQILNKFILSDDYIFKKNIVTRFIIILSILHQLDFQSFKNSILHITGRTRLYFSNNPDILLYYGIQTKPKNIPLTPYWVITNTNTLRKIIIIKKIMFSMNFSKKIIQNVCKSIIGYPKIKNKKNEKILSLVS